MKYARCQQHNPGHVRFCLGGGDHGCASVRNCRGVMTRSGSRARRSIQRPKSATSPVTKWAAWATIAAARSGRSLEDSSAGVSRSTSAGAGSLTTRTAVRLLCKMGSAAGRFASRFRSASTIARGEVRSVTRPAAPSSTRSAESPSGLYAAVKRTLASRKTRRSATTAMAARAGLQAPAPAERRPLTRVDAIRPDQALDLLVGIERDRGHGSGIQDDLPGLFPHQQDRAWGEPQACAHGLGQGDLAPRRDDQGRSAGRRARSHRSTSTIILAEFLQFRRSGAARQAPRGPAPRTATTMYRGTKMFFWLEQVNAEMATLAQERKDGGQ